MWGCGLQCRDGNRVVFAFLKRKEKNNELKRRINEGDVVAQKQREKVKSLPKRGTFQCRAPSCVHAYIAMFCTCQK